MKKMTFFLLALPLLLLASCGKDDDLSNDEKFQCKVNGEEWHANFSVNVYDVLGKQHFSGNMEDGGRISVVDWPSGLYWLTAIDEVTRERSTVKLVVSKN